MRRAHTSAVVALALLLAVGQPARAHKMIAASRVYDDGMVLVQAFFPDGKPARGVEVKVSRPDGSVFLSSQTDDQGKLTVSPDGAAGEWTATFTGSMGHKTTCTFLVRQHEASSRAGSLPDPPAQGASPGDAAPPPVARVTETAKQHGDSLAQAEPFPWANVLAGLGFIFGLSAFILCLKLRAQLR